MEYIWIARDANGDLFKYLKEPKSDGTEFIPTDIGCIGIPNERFPDIKPMECKKFKLVEVKE